MADDGLCPSVARKHLIGCSEITVSPADIEAKIAYYHHASASISDVQIAQPKA